MDTLKIKDSGGCHIDSLIGDTSIWLRIILSSSIALPPMLESDFKDSERYNVSYE